MFDYISGNDDTSLAATPTFDYQPSQPTTPAYTNDQATTRAQEVDYALGSNSPGVDNIHTFLTTGNEDRLQQQQLANEHLMQNYKRQQRVIDFVQQGTNAGVDSTPQDFEDLVNKDEASFNQLVSNPSEYFNKKKAQALTREIEPPPTNDDDSDETSDANSVDSLGLRKFLSRQFGYQSILKEAEYGASNQDGIEKLGNFVLSVTPYSWWNSHNVVKNAPTSSLLKGNDIRAQVDYLNSLPEDEAVNKAREAVKDVSSRNPYDGVAFARALVEYSSSDQFIDNALEALNVATGFTATSAGRLGLRGASAVRNFTKAASLPGATIPGVLDATGQTLRAAYADTITRFRAAADQTSSGARPGSFQDLSGQAQGIFNPTSFLGNQGASRLSAAAYTRLENDLLQNGEALANANLDVNNILRTRTGSEANLNGRIDTIARWNQQYAGLNNHVLGVDFIRAQNNALANTDHVVISLGRTTGVPFAERYEAEAIANLNGLNPKTFSIEERGPNAFVIKVTKAIDETAPTVRNGLGVDTFADPTPHPTLNRFFGWFRTADTQLPKEINEERKVAQSGAQSLHGLNQSILENSFGRLPGRWRSASRREFVNFLHAQQDQVNTATGVRGVFSDSVHDFEVDFNNLVGRFPSEQETHAYATYRQVSDSDWVTNNLNVYRAKTRLGLENFHFLQRGVKIKVPPQIEGKFSTLDDLYRHEGDAGILIWDHSSAGNPTLMRKNFTNAAQRATIADLVNNQGYKVINLTHGGQEALHQYPLVTFGRGDISYVLARDYQSTPLSLRQVPYRPGGHQIYRDPFYVSQPNITATYHAGTLVHDYFGDRNFLNFRTREQANHYLPLIERARVLLNNPNQLMLRRFLRQNRLPISYGDFRSMFDPSRGGIFDSNVPFFVRTGNNRVHDEVNLARHDLFGPNFHDRMSSPHDPLNQDATLRFLHQRDEPLSTIVNTGSLTAPVLNMQLARRLDPIVALQRAIMSITRGRYLDDLKIKSAERFVREFGDVLRKEDYDELTRFPIKALYGDHIELSHPDNDRIIAAKNYRRSMREFVSINDEDSARSVAIVNHIAQFALNRGPLATRVFDYVEPHLMSTINDPSRFFRNLAFIPRMGFWNPKQFFMQAQGVAHTAAVEGVARATMASAGAGWMRGLGLRRLPGPGGVDTILDHAANQARDLAGWDPDHFKEAYRGFVKSRFNQIGGEYATSADFLNPQVIRGPGGRILEHGLKPFKAGEYVNRNVAYNAAYLRWREANPLARFDDTASKQVLNRANLLALDMTRASNAGFNKGFAAVPTQFFTYQARLMDQMFGSRLTNVEKLRVATLYSFLYGIPAGTAGTALGVFWPWNEQAKQSAQEYGINTNTPAWETFLNGAPQTLLHGITGVNPDLSQFGPGGLKFFRDVWTGDKSAVELGGGASAKTIVDLTASLASLMRAGYLNSEPLLSAIVGTTQVSGSDKYYPLAWEDFSPLLNNIGTINQSQKAYYAYTLNKYFTKQGRAILTDAENPGWNAFFSGVFGADPDAVTEYYNSRRTKEGLRDGQRDARAQALQAYSMAYDKNTSDEDRMRYLARAHAALRLGDFTERQAYEILKDSIGDKNIDGLDEIKQDLDTATQTRRNWYFERLLKGRY